MKLFTQNEKDFNRCKTREKREIGYSSEICASF